LKQPLDNHLIKIRELSTSSKRHHLRHLEHARKESEVIKEEESNQERKASDNEVGYRRYEEGKQLTLTDR
jgi:hypothetical protein